MPNAFFFFLNYNFKITKWNCSARQTSALTTNIGLVAGTSELGGITRLLVLKAWNDEENPSSASFQCAGCWSAFPGCSFHPSAKISNAQMIIEKLRYGRGEKFSTAHRLSWLHCHNQKWLSHSVLKAKWGLIEADVMGSWQESCHNRWACVGVSKRYIPVCMPPCCPPQHHKEDVRGAQGVMCHRESLHHIPCHFWRTQGHCSPKFCLALWQDALAYEHPRGKRYSEADKACSVAST